MARVVDIAQVVQGRVSPDRRRRPSGPDAGPQQVGQAIAKVLSRIGASPSPHTMELVFTRWEEVVGAELAAHSQPMRLQDSTLVVGADHPAWATRARMDSEADPGQRAPVGRHHHRAHRSGGPAAVESPPKTAEKR